MYISRLETPGDHKPEIGLLPKTRIFFFFTTQQCYLTQSGLKRPHHMTRDLSSEREFRCSLQGVCMSQFHCGNENKQGHKVQKNKL